MVGCSSSKNYYFPCLEGPLHGHPVPPPPSLGLSGQGHPDQPPNESTNRSCEIFHHPTPQCPRILVYIALIIPFRTERLAQYFDGATRARRKEREVPSRLQHFFGGGRMFGAFRRALDAAAGYAGSDLTCSACVVILQLE